MIDRIRNNLRPVYGFIYTTNDTDMDDIRKCRRPVMMVNGLSFAG